MCEDTETASEVAARNGCDPAIDDPTQPCPYSDLEIVSVAWLDGDDATTTASATQYVNLPRAAKWADDAAGRNIDRLGLKPRFKVTFNKPMAANFKYRLIPVAGGTPAYTAAEKGRNARFEHTRTDKSGATGADGTGIVSDGVELVAGGGYKFKLEAEDEKGNKVQTGVLTTKRLFWYVEAKMAGLGSILGSTADVDAEYAKHHIELSKLPALAIPHQENIGSAADSATLQANVAAAVDGSATTKAKEPHLLTVAYTDHLAVKNPDVPLAKDGVQVGPGKPKVVIPVTARGLRPPHTVAPRKLWHDLVAGEEWFVSAKFVDAAGNETEIPEAKVSNGANWDAIEIDVTGLPAGAGRIDAVVHVVDRMRGGLALGGANQTCVCTRAWWRTRSDASQTRTIIHEIGHKVQMVCDGSGIEPDKPANQYSGKGHVGRHCHTGCPAGEATYGTSAMRLASTCVMFGTANGHTAFCAECSPVVKKVDLSAGW